MPLLTDPVVAPGALAHLSQPSFDLGDVVLRPWQRTDAAAVSVAFADPEIRRWHVRSLDAAEAQAWVDGWSGRWRREVDAGWAITNATGLLGQISLRNLRLSEGISSLSYWVVPAARGRGLAGRALGAIGPWAFTDLGLYRLQLEHSTANEASCRVALTAGYPAEGIKRGAGLHADGWHDMHLHARLASD